MQTHYPVVSVESIKVRMREEISRYPFCEVKHETAEVSCSCPAVDHAAGESDGFIHIFSRIIERVYRELSRLSC